MPLINTNGERVEPPFIIDGVRHPDDIEIKWSGADLAAIGLAVEVVVDDAPDLLTHAKSARWRKEVGGMEFHGFQVATDDRSKLLLTNVRLRSMSDPDHVETWVAMDGSLHPLNSALIEEMSLALAEHVSKCFSVYAAVKTKIDDGTIVTFGDIDAAFAAF